MIYKGIIFDLDGTLLDTLEDLADSFNHALEENGFPAHPVEAYRYFVGNGAQKAVERALPDLSRKDKIIDKVLTEFKTWYDRHYHIKSAPYQGIMETLDELQKMNFNLAVLSNKPHEFTGKCVQHYFPDIFDLVQGHRYDFPRKPEPASTKHILEALELTAEQTLFVGDTRTDIETAKNGGLMSVGVAWGFRGEAELKAAGADYIIHQPRELFKI